MSSLHRQIVPTLALVLLSEGAANAQEATRPPEVVHAEASEWYGLPILVTDVASAGLVSVGLATFSFKNQNVTGPVILAGTAGYSLGAPIIHAANGEWEHAGASLFLRAVPFIAWGVVREAVRDEAVGNWIFAGGVVAAMVIDNVLLTKHSKKQKGGDSGVALAPAIDLKNRGGSLQLAGAF